MNCVTLVGNLTRDPEVRFTKTGKSVCNFSVACSEEYMANNEIKEVTAFINCQAWGKMADMVGNMRKGNRIMVAGRINTRSYEDRDGKKVYVTEVIANSIGGAIDIISNDSSSSFDSFSEEPSSKKQENSFSETEIPF